VVYFELFDDFLGGISSFIVQTFLLKLQKELERFVQPSRFHGPIKDLAASLAFSIDIETV
jgi:hypothetical protein